jgi:hypothetical protein
MQALLAGGARRQAHDAADRAATMLLGLDKLLSPDLRHGGSAATVYRR